MVVSFFFSLVLFPGVIYLFIYVCVCVRVLNVFFPSYGLRVIHTLFFSSSSLLFKGHLWAFVFELPNAGCKGGFSSFSSFSGHKGGGEKSSKQLVFKMFTTCKIWYRNWFFSYIYIYDMENWGLWDLMKPLW